MQNESMTPLLTVSASLIGGGAAGALITAYIQKIRKTRDDRKNLTGEIISFSQNAIAALMKNNVLMGIKDTFAAINLLADLRVIVAKGHQTEALMFQNFKDRRTLAAFHRLLLNIQRTQQRFENTNSPIGNHELDRIKQWIKESEVDAFGRAARDAGIPLNVPGELIFAGFTKKQRQKRLRELSFDPEPAPWEFHVGIAEGEKLDRTASNILEDIKTRAGSLLCPTHRLPVHITVSRGSGEVFNFTVEGCCEDFISETRRLVEGQ